MKSKSRATETASPTGSEDSSDSELDAGLPGWSFPPTHAAYLREKLPDYESAGKKEKSRVVVRVSHHIRDEIEKQSGSPLSDEKRRHLLEARNDP
jgi:hypothetical protein